MNQEAICQFGYCHQKVTCTSLSSARAPSVHRRDLPVASLQARGVALTSRA